MALYDLDYAILHAHQKMLPEVNHGGNLFREDITGSIITSCRYFNEEENKKRTRSKLDVIGHPPENIRLFDSNLCQKIGVQKFAYVRPAA